MVNCLATGADGRALGDLAPEAFDAVLADVPCSCEGNVRKARGGWEACVEEMFFHGSIPCRGEHPILLGQISKKGLSP